MAPFPCPSERTAASALLLLTATPPKFCLDGDDESSVRSERGKSKSTKCRDQSFVSGDSNSSCISVLASSDVSKDEIQARKIRMIALAALHRDVKLKAVQKSRWKIQSGVKFNSWKTSSGIKVAMTTSFASTSSESSCLSTSSSAASSRYKSMGGSLSKLGTVVEHPKTKKKKQKQLGSVKLRRKAEAILDLLSQGCYSEVKIRQTLGDSPDTSKALRLLLKFEEVKRSGAGGRRSPYIYTIA